MPDDPYRIHADFGDGVQEPGLLVWYGPGPTVNATSRENHCLLVRGDGTLHEMSRDFVTFDFRYDPVADRWIDLRDIGNPPGDQVDMEQDGGPL